MTTLEPCPPPTPKCPPNGQYSGPVRLIDWAVKMIWGIIDGGE